MAVRTSATRSHVRAPQSDRNALGPLLTPPSSDIATVKPDSEKSNTEHAGDFLKGKGDKLGSAAQPESEKSYIQQATDAITGSK